MIEVRISFDYELLWGVWDKVPPRYVANNIANANTATRGLITAHKRHDIPCTFAIVGAMLIKNQSPHDVMASSQRPESDKMAFDAMLDDHAVTPDLTFAPDDVVDSLHDNPLFEVGAHTQTHIYALDATDAALADDFQQLKRTFIQRFGTNPRALVMPKNQVTPAAMRIARDAGFDSIRVNPDSWVYRPIVWGPMMARLIRLLRIADTFLPIVELGRAEMFAETRKNDLRLHVGQYFLRPWFARKGLFTLHLWRLKLALFIAMRRGHQVHFWLHPHNLGRSPEQALANYDLFLGWLKRHEAAASIRFAHMSDAVEPTFGS